jgi:hypothetical protein
MVGLINFVKSHPVIGGVAFVVFGILMVYLSVDGAKRFRLFENADQVNGRVLSITEASRFPPRFDVAVAWPDGSSAEQTVIRTGPRAAETLKAGDVVEILVSKINGAVILADQRPEDGPIHLGGFEATPIIFFGIGASVFGILLALYGERWMKNA